MMSKKGIDEFAYVLLAGLLIIIIMLIAWGVPPSEVPEVNVTNITGVFLVGSSYQDVPRHILIGDFTVSYEVGSKVLAEETEIEIRRGLTVNEYKRIGARIDQSMDSITGGFLLVDVLDTNSLGKLVIKVNDEVVFNQKVQPGRVHIPIDKTMLKEYNIIEFSSTGPGWMFWSSSVYKLEKVEFGINFLGRSEKTEYFEVYEDELKKFKSGRLEFEVGEHSGEGKLIVSINNREVYVGVPSGKIVREFDSLDVGLSTGLNVITFSSQPGTSYEIEDAFLTIIHEEAGKKKRSFEFYVDSSGYEKLKEKKGTVRFYILETDYSGSLIVSIENPEGVEHTIKRIGTYSVGEPITAEFDYTYVKIGVNKINFEVSGEGYFLLSNVNIQA